MNTKKRLQCLEAQAINAPAGFDYCPHIAPAFVYYERMNDPDTAPPCACGKPRFRYTFVPAPFPTCSECDARAMPGRETCAAHSADRPDRANLHTA